MNDARYKKLLRELQKLEKAVAKDLLARCRERGPVHDRMVVRHAAAEVGGVPDDWFPIAAGRAAVQFLLRTVYVRVLEDLGLLEPHRIRGQRGYQAFRELAPNLGRQAYFRWIFRDLARDFPALFEPGPDEPGMPAEALCEALWELWHKEDGKGGLFYDFTPAEGETFDGRFLGDLYQDLDADVRKRYALLQTPEFVESYILDYTLAPAIEAFDPAELRDSGETFRMLDPTCGSGHFLLGGFKRLFRYWTEKEPALSALERVQRALDSVWGCDINEYAVAVARFRLLVTAWTVASDERTVRIEQLAALRLDLTVCDSLVPWERGLAEPELFPAIDRLSRYATLQEREKNAAFFGVPIHAVVANPPYIRAKDAKKIADYKVFWPDSAAGLFALSAPFAERVFDLACPGGFAGQITSNSFTKRSFGRTVITKGLAKFQLTRVVDAAGAYLPGHGTPTVIIFGRNLPRSGGELVAILGKRGEPLPPSDPSKGLVWSAIAQAGDVPNDSSPFVTVLTMERSLFHQHPWRLKGGDAPKVAALIESNATHRLRVLKPRVGNSTQLKADDLYLMRPPAVARDAGVPQIEFLQGEHVRDWGAGGGPRIAYPYDPETQSPLGLPTGSATLRSWWGFRSVMLKRPGKGFRTIAERGQLFYEYPIFTARVVNSTCITFAFVSTHNHFVLSNERRTFNRSAPVVHIDGASEEDLADLSALLNTSTLGFWMKQVMHCKGYGASSTGARTTASEWENFYEFDGTKLKEAPLSERDRDQRVRLSNLLHRRALGRRASLPATVLAGNRGERLESATTLAEALEEAHLAYLAHSEEMVALQEELDWLTYGTFGLVEETGAAAVVANLEPVEGGHRPFELALARARGEESLAYFRRHDRTPTLSIPTRYSTDTRRRIQQRLDLIESNKSVRLLEQPEYKRRWEPIDWDKAVEKACESWLLDWLEDLFAGGALKEPRPHTLDAIAAAWRSDPRVLAVAEVYAGTASFDLVDLAARLLRDNALPDNPYRIYSDEGLRKYRRWQWTWKLQDQEDAWEADGDPDKGPLKLTDPDTGEPLDEIPVPPKFKKTDFAKTAYYSIRGKLNVPRERFIQFADLTPVHYGWNGWCDEARADAAAKAFEIAEQHPDQPLTEPPTAADPRRCGPALNLWDSLDDVRRWGSAEAHEEFRFLAEDVCKQSSCPCDVITAWQKWVADGGKPGDPAPGAPATRVAISPEERKRAHDALAKTEGGLTRKQLSAQLGLGGDEVDALVADLLADGSVVESSDRRRIQLPDKQANLFGK